MSVGAGGVVVGWGCAVRHVIDEELTVCACVGVVKSGSV